MGTHLACSSDELSHVGHAQHTALLCPPQDRHQQLPAELFANVLWPHRPSRAVLHVGRACLHCLSCTGFISILPSCFSPQPFPSSSLLLWICSRCLLNLPGLPVPSIFLTNSFQMSGNLMFSSFAQVLHSFSERADLFPSII